jgi:hypothetical protein
MKPSVTRKSQKFPEGNQLRKAHDKMWERFGRSRRCQANRHRQMIDYIDAASLFSINTLAAWVDRIGAMSYPSVWVRRGPCGWQLMTVIEKG